MFLWHTSPSTPQLLWRAVLDPAAFTNAVYELTHRWDFLLILIFSDISEL